MLDPTYLNLLTGALPAALLAPARGAVGGRARRLGGSLARVGGVHAWVGQIVLECVCDEFKTIFAIRPLSTMDGAMLAAEATP